MKDDARRARLRRRMGCALGAVMLLFGLVLGEVLVRVLAPENPTAGHELYVAHPDSSIGWRLRPGADYEEGGTRVTIDARGLRDRGRPLEKPPGVRRVLVLGDSFTFGSAVAAEDAYPQQLERLLAPVEVVNAGVPRYSTAQEAAWLASEGLAWRPDAIVVGFFVGNDVWENLTGTHGAELRVENGELVQRAREERSALRRLRNRSRLYRLLKELPQLAADRLGGDTPLLRKYHELEGERLAVCLRDEPRSWTDAWARTREALVRIRDVARGIPVVLLVIPDEAQVDAELFRAVCERRGLAPADYDLDLPQRRVAELAKELGFPLVDPLPDLRARTAQGERLYIPLDSHWNARGHRLAAEALAPALRRT